MGDDATVKVTKDGPYRVSGSVTLTDADGNRFELPEGRGFSLCRCGQSSNKPFCDGTHHEAGFQSDPKAAGA